jgi:ribosomal protein S18 acetylase RimI-like enzyme
MIEAGPVVDEDELGQILDLQRRNLARNLSEREIGESGFVTVEHTLDVLRRMHALAPSIVARDGADLAGYALVMPVECRSFIPVLEPMFQRLEALGLFRKRFYVMGQICVATPYRGRGVFDLLYRTHRERLRGRFDSAVTEVATRNLRSLRAHRRIGFEELERYRDATDEWVLLIWRW